MSVTSTDIWSQLGISRAGANTAERRTELGQDDFLRLMTEQLKNQDPLKPMGNTEMIGQMAQFSTVKGIETLNSNMTGVAYMLGESQALQAASMVGRSAYVSTDTAVLEQDGSVKGAVEASGAGAVNIEIRDHAGRVVRTMSVAASSAGSMDFEWDGVTQSGGTAEPGTYTITATQGGKAVDLQIASRIESVSYTAKGTVLNLLGFGPATFDLITRIG